MALGTSLFLIALGAVLRFALHVTAHGFNIHTVGVILMIVGVVGLLVSLLWMALWSPRRRRVVAGDDRAYPPRGRVSTP